MCIDEPQIRTAVSFFVVSSFTGSARWSAKWRRIFIYDAMKADALKLAARMPYNDQGNKMLVVNTPLVAWLVVLASGVLEVIFSVSMKLSNSYTKMVPGALSVVAAILSVWLMSFTLKILPLGTAYAVWAGIGAAGTALVGLFWFQEPASLGRLLCIGLVIAGIVGLQFQEGG